MSDFALSFRGVDFSIQKRQILKNIGFDVQSGSVFAIVGHNGAGKTTLFHLILGLKIQKAGEILLLGKSNLSPEARINVGYVPERPYVNLDMSLRDLLTFHAHLAGIAFAKCASEVERVAVQVGLQKNLDRDLSTFSKGMLQKALLAQAMLGDPEFLILDEPMSGLDPEARADVRAQVNALKNLKKTLIFSSHTLEDVDQLADFVLTLQEGTVQFVGSVQEWRARR